MQKKSTALSRDFAQRATVLRVALGRIARCRADRTVMMVFAPKGLGALLRRTALTAAPCWAAGWLLGRIEPEFDFRCIDVEASPVMLSRRKVIPLARHQPPLSRLGADDELARRDDADVLGRMAVRLDGGPSGVGREEDVAALRGKAPGLERPLESRERLDALGESRHAIRLHGLVGSRSNEAAILQRRGHLAASG